MKHITFYLDVVSPYAWLAFEHLPELPTEVEAVLHRDVHTLPGLGAVGVARVACDEHARHLGLLHGIVELVGEPVCNLIDAVPRSVFHIE